MVFSDLFFLFVFLPLFVICYLAAYYIDKKKSLDGAGSMAFKNAVLVAFSLIFYAWGEPIYVFLMLICVIINYFTGKFIENSIQKRQALIIGVACNVLILCVFKYAGFFAETLNAVGIPIPVPEISLPIGVSFYIFQSISYLVDVYRKESKAQTRFVDLLLYISMFPQLIAGPIVRYNTVAEEINNRKVSFDDIADGVYRFMIGLAKKVIIANQIGSIADQYLKVGLESSSTLGLMLGLLAFSLQIYFDFSGYSDMAIGIGRCLGFHFNENFNHPYCCNSVTDFWRRWHISLGSFFRDYVYIPMGGNRKNQWRNVLCVWFLTGMWHGASWNFIIWGLFFGVILVIEKLFILKRIKTLPAVGHIYSLLMVYIGWGIFYFTDFESMKLFFSRIFTYGEFYNFADVQAVSGNLWLWIAAIALCMPVRKILEEKITKPEFTCAYRITVSVLVILFSTALLVGATNNAFLYFRF
ncbi:MAG: MBOAT family protein [Bacteroidales bacterium]|nr:MBOAT family protein [Bacteroidales bacterium]